ncbi:hypothetical protein [Lysinibacillus fusiformis]|uniref:hypothetical protein n=1 Tax=Lysinibacillus fusiformis TaxID=28031 RepID=UPI003D092AA4
MTEPREWTLAIPADTVWINSNYRNGWRRHANLVKWWRQTAHWHATAAKLPKGLDRIYIEATFAFRDNRRRDVHNLMPTVKAAVDGLVDYGLIEDDSTKYLLGPDLRVGDKLPSGRWLDHGVLTLTICRIPPGSNERPLPGVEFDLEDSGDL